ncbi:DOMON-like domain-containing protein [Croceicoccus bisphenolivorans]|uniref:DOMON-like domain-containing protein n=1 Tax=Croceicoccus bisphenolivorans TaxID=1783232 RepID=UPI00082BFFAA|nr:DOMON-like domain-containing protein [Croceicoccus bisphenolivorans]
MQPLVPHPAHPPLAIRSVEAEIIFPNQGLAMARFRIDGIEELVIPEFAGRGRQDELWQTTCFELFALRDDGSYREFNFSTSGRWAVYDFDGPRTGMADHDPMQMPAVSAKAGDRMLAINVSLMPRDLAGFTRAGLTAVIEETGGHKSFWALEHSRDVPDFHDPACFTVPLAAPARP